MVLKKKKKKDSLKKQRKCQKLTIFELSNRECKITMINILRFLIEKVDNMQGWMGSIRREKKN